MPDNQLVLPQQQRWQFQNLPLALANHPHWVPCYLKGDMTDKGPVTTEKRPRGGAKPTSHSRSLDKMVIEDNRVYGVQLTPSDSLVCIDIDHTRTLPSQVQTMLLRHNPTYQEYSPSGNGLHVWYLVDKAHKVLAEIKDQEKLQWELPPTQDLDTEQVIKGSLMFQNQFVTMTGHFVGEYPEDVTRISPEELALFVQTSKPEKTTREISLSALDDRHTTVSKEDAEHMLMFIPPSLTGHPDQYEYQRAYAGFEGNLGAIDDYEHWRHVAAALHHIAYCHNDIDWGRELFVKWSSFDEHEENFSAKAAAAKYDENPPKASGIRGNTLAALYQSVTLRWPLTDRRGTPLPGNLRNWEYALTRRYNLRFSVDELKGGIRVQGPAMVMDKYFKVPAKDKKDLGTKLHWIATGRLLTHGTKRSALEYAEHLVLEAPRYNPLKELILSTPSNLTGVSELDKLLDTLTFPLGTTPDRERLYRTYITKNLFSLIRALFYEGPFSDNAGIVIFMGDESAKKTSWQKMLMPPELSDYVTEVKDRSTRAMWLVGLQNYIVVHNEIEQDLEAERFSSRTQAEGRMKDYVTGDSEEMRLLGTDTTKKGRRQAILWGSTNLSQLPMPDTGSRRFWVVKVIDCDTTAMLKVNIALVFRELFDRYLRTPDHLKPTLWTLTEEEKNETTRINAIENRDADSIEVQIGERYCLENIPTEAELRTLLINDRGNLDKKKLIDSGRLVTPRELRRKLELETYSPKVVKSRALSILGRWSGTSHHPLMIGSYTYHRGFLKMGNTEYWLLPEPRIPFETEDNLD